jgi:hypothetical protein
MLSKASSALKIPKSLYLKAKPFTLHLSECSQITEWIEVSVMELHNLLKKDITFGHVVEQEELCSICQCELYENIHTASDDEVETQQKAILASREIPVIKFKDCCNHFYHKECADGFLQGKSYVKCGVCFKIYGEYIGDQPTGEFDWILHSPGKYPCEGYESDGTWIINYMF